MKINVKIDNQNYEVNIGDLKSRPIIATVDGQSLRSIPKKRCAWLHRSHPRR